MNKTNQALLTIVLIAAVALIIVAIYAALAPQGDAVFDCSDSLSATDEDGRVVYLSCEGCGGGGAVKTHSFRQAWKWLRGKRRSCFPMANALTWNAGSGGAPLARRRALMGTLNRQS